MSEVRRIELIVRRDGEAAARAWVERTLEIYRAALASGGYAASAPYRPLFEQSIREFEQWLAGSAEAASEPSAAADRTGAGPDEGGGA